MKKNPPLTFAKRLQGKRKEENLQEICLYNILPISRKKKHIIQSLVYKLKIDPLILNNIFSYQSSECM